MSHDSISSGPKKAAGAGNFVSETMDATLAGGLDFNIPQGSRYVLHEEIARGGMGIIFHATDRVLGRSVAVKVLKEKYTLESGTALRFCGEARITSQLQHPGIPPVHDLGTLPDGRLFLAMKLIKGDTLLSLLSQRPTHRHQHAEFIAVFEQLCHAVAYAHSRNVIHRDLKPQNVMVGAFGEVQVMDWGLAKVLVERAEEAEQYRDEQQTSVGTVIHNPRDSSGSDPASTEAGSMLGTLAFMPPEQAIGDIPEITAQSDVFGLGAILAVIITGVPPYVAKDVNELRVKAIRGDLDECYARLDACEAESGLIDLCKRCLAFSRVERPKDAGVVAREVAAFRTGASERALQAELDRAAEAAKRLEAAKRRRVWRGAVAAVVLSIMAGLGTVAYVQARAKAVQIASNHKLKQSNDQLRQLFEFALKSIRQFHSGVSDEVLFSRPEFADLRDRLLKSAQDFYGELGSILAGQQDHESKLALARSLANVGSITRTVGSAEEAVKPFRDAVKVFKSLLEGANSGGELLREQAMAQLSLGELLAESGQSSDAQLTLEEGLKHLQSFVDLQPIVDVTMLIELSKAHLTLARFWERNQGGQAAEREFLEALRFAEQAKQQFGAADARNQLAHCLSSFAWYLRKNGAPEADDRFDQALAEREQLVKDYPDEPAFRMSLASTYQNSGYVSGEEAAKRDDRAGVEKAVALLDKARDLLEPVRALQPTNSGLQLDIARCHDFCGVVLRDIDCARALQENQKALDIREPLAKRYPKVLEYQSLYARSLDLQANLLQEKDSPMSMKMRQAARSIRQRIVEQNPSDHAAQSELAWSEHNRGFVLAGSNQLPEAKEAHREALRLRLGLVRAQPSNAEYFDAALQSYDHLSRLLTEKEDSAEAQNLYRSGLSFGKEIDSPLWQLIMCGYLLCWLEQQGEPHRNAEIAEVEREAIAILQAAVAGGWRLTEEHVKKIHCERIRNHEEIRKLIHRPQEGSTEQDVSH